MNADVGDAAAPDTGSAAVAGPVARGADAPGALARRLAVLTSALPGRSAAEAIEAARRAGTGIEWGIGSDQAITGDSGGIVDQVRAGCTRAGLDICGACLQDPDALTDEGGRLGKIVRLAAALGAPHLRIMPPPYAGGRLEAELATLQRVLEKVVELASREGTRVLVEPAAGSVAPSPELVCRLIEPYSPDVVGAVYDPGSLIAEGHLAPELAVATFGRYLRHVHMKNVSWGRTGVDGWRLRYESLDAGLVDWRRVSSVLTAAGYDGWIVIDHLRGPGTAGELCHQASLARNLLSDGSGG